MASAVLLSAGIARSWGPLELGKSVLGEQSYIALVSSLLATLLIGAFSSTAVQVLSAARDSRPADLAWLTRATTVALVGAGVVSAAVMLAVGSRADVLRVVWVIAATTVLVDAIGIALQSRVVANEGWSRVGARRLLFQILSPLMGVAALLLGLGIPGVFAAQTLASVGGLLWILPLVRQQPPPSGASAAPRPTPRALLVLAGGFFTAGLFITLLERRLEIVFIERLSTADQIAAYSTAFNLFAVAFFVCSSLTFAALPSVAALAAGGEMDKVHGAMRRAGRLLVTFSILLGAAVASVGPGLVLFIYGPEFSDASGLVPWMCLSLLLAPLAGVARVYWTGLGLLRPVLATGAVGLLADVALCLALIPAFGARGAVAANLGGVAAGSLSLLVMTHRRTGGLRIGGRPVLGAAAVAGPSAAAALLVHAAAPGLVGVLASGVAFCAVALLVSRVVHPVAGADVTWLAGALPQRAGPAVEWLGTPQLAPTRSARSRTHVDTRAGAGTHADVDTGAGTGAPR